LCLLSSSFAPFHSKFTRKLKQTRTQSHTSQGGSRNGSKKRWTIEYFSWAATILLLVGVGFQYNQLQQTSNQVVKMQQLKKIKMEQELNQLELKTRKAKLV
jgi:hypothetical protein